MVIASDRMVDVSCGVGRTGSTECASWSETAEISQLACETLCEATTCSMTCHMVSKITMLLVKCHHEHHS